MSKHPLAWKLDRSIPSQLPSGRAVIDELLGRFESENWSSRDIFGIRLALEEAVVNAIKHGNRLDAAKRVHVICHSTPEKIWIKVSDEGPGFDPEQVPDCTDDAHIDVPNGRGIMLMRNYMSPRRILPAGQRRRDGKAAPGGQISWQRVAAVCQAASGQMRHAKSQSRQRCCLRFGSKCS